MSQRLCLPPLLLAEKRRRAHHHLPFPLVRSGRLPQPPNPKPGERRVLFREDFTVILEKIAPQKITRTRVTKQAYRMFIKQYIFPLTKSKSRYMDPVRPSACVQRCSQHGPAQAPPCPSPSCLPPASARTGPVLAGA